MMENYEYSFIWKVFENWVEEGKLTGLVANPNKVDDLDRLIFKLFDLAEPKEDDYGSSVKGGPAIHAMMRVFEGTVSDKDVEWLFSPHAYALYKIKIARKTIMIEGTPF